MYEYLTVGKLKSVLNGLPDEANIWFWKELENNQKTEVTLNEFIITHHAGDKYKIPTVSFIVED